ncbi:MAG: FHA domain-containing protein [Paludibacteraceae bacterium]|nr:FHA domain-containing protein [Paludibacteraceae bacterium]
MKTITIGRYPDNNVVVNDPVVGRHHAKITRHNDGRFTITDLNSRNGTFVNGKRVSGEIRLNPGDVVQVGRTTLPWMSYFPRSARKPQKSILRGMIPVLLMFVCGALLTVVLLIKGKSGDVYTDNASFSSMRSEQSGTSSRRGNYADRRDNTEYTDVQTSNVPSVSSDYDEWMSMPESERIIQESNAIRTAQTQYETGNSADLRLYVDLGLSSGTLWKRNNESGYYEYQEAVNIFGNSLPRKSQMEELVENCKWVWTGDGYSVYGPNGCSIFLPADGYQGCDDRELYDSGYCGFLWSVMAENSRSAWILDFFDPNVEFATIAVRRHYSVTTYEKCRGISVRLVK